MYITRMSPLDRWLIFTFLILLSYALLQPAFEGFDESAHYSRVLDASNDLTTQFSGGKLFNSRILDYPGPRSYGSGEPPFSGDKTYDIFYLQSLEVLTSVKTYSTLEVPSKSNTKENWQYQHPPLYYFLMGAFNRLASPNTLVFNVIVLRIFSIFLSTLALRFCYKALECLGAKTVLNSSLMSSAAGIFALCFPMFCFEFARIGNDALVFFCLSIAFYCSVKAYKSDQPQLYLMGMSLSLAFGLWTKAVVLPLLPVFAMYAAYSLWTSKSGKQYSSILKDFFWVYLLPVALGLAWYVFLYLKFHDLGIGSEARELGQSSGLINGLYAHFSIVQFIRGLSVPLASFIYAGSWSLLRAPLSLYLLLAFIYGVLMLRYISVVSQSKDRVFGFLPLVLAASLYAGLSYHILVSMALSGLGTSGGWYFYVLSPWLLMAISFAVEKIPSLMRMGIQVIGLFITAGLFFTNALIYSGFIVKGDDKAMRFNPDVWAELFQSAAIRLDYVSYPRIALLLFSAALLLAVYNLCNNETKPKLKI